MRLLLTGGSGYLGRRLFMYLTEHDIICPCIPGTEHSINKFGNATIVSTEDDQLLKKVLDFSVETVINVAGVYDNQPFGSVLSGNLVFPVTILDYLSTSKLKKWINVNTSLPRMLSSYALAKHQLGDWGNYYSNKHSFTFIDIQLEQFYGPFDGRFLSFVVNKLLANEQLELTECLQKRDMIHVDDVCSSIVCLLNADLHGYMSIPVGSGIAPILREVVEYCKTVINSESTIHYGAVPVRAGEPMFSIADISEITKLGFKPKWNWKDGLMNMIEEMRK